MRKLILFLLIITFIGCGKRVYVDYLPDKMTIKKDKHVSKVLILPFSSYNLANSPKMWMDLNIMLHNAITDTFVRHNIVSVPYEDVFTMLKRKGLIKFSNFKTSSDLIREYQDSQWSSDMKKEIAKLIAEERQNQKQYKQLETVCYITENQIFDLNKNFNSDYIVRGSITEIKITKEETFDPFKIGFVNAPLKLLSRALYGVGETDGWSRGQEVFTGAMIGGILGGLSNEPLSPPSHKTKVIGHPLFGRTVTKRYGGNSNYEWGNAAFWGAIAGFGAFVASHGGDTSKISLGLRIYIYDGKTKELIWTNRVKLHVTPESVWGEHDVSELVLQAVEESVDKVFKLFWQNYAFWKSTKL